MPRLLQRALLPVALAIGLLTTLTTPADASVFRRSAVCVSWGCGYAEMTFSYPDRIDDLTESVRNTSCGNYVWIALQMEYTDGRLHVTPWFAAGSCNDGYRTKHTSWKANGRIRTARAVLHWHSDTAHPAERFAYGDWVTNPYA